MFKDKNSTARILPQGNKNEDAVFLGWQRTRSNGDLALYTITVEGHPSNGSTVTDKTLQKLNLQVPSTPPLYEPLKKL
jgi:hypothetical protein